MSQTGQFHGGLVFTASQDHSVLTFSQSVRETLLDYGYHVDRQTRVDHERVRLTCARYQIKISYREDGPEAMRLGLVVCPIDEASDEEAKHLLALMLHRITATHQPDHVEWLCSDAPPMLQHRRRTLNGHGISPFARPPAHRTPSERRPSKPVTLTEQSDLAMAFRSRPTAIDPLGNLHQIAVWGITGVVATLSAPIAIALVAFNLFLGGSIPVNTGVLATTAAAIFTQPSGAAADVLSIWPF
ncbi:hypothetical protein [Thalassococcus sp. S3]|uniref:hypothetical protein n=1 Tax=Thalassococcus sp. S3 TaxID=2017482 RepID=UPI00102436FF|nr:hypothetical protein [Thalassococcus sp. S3]QBF32705.1 hypothetical protein CFI11_16000 [Thalassococcus sp. S3]